MYLSNTSTGGNKPADEVTEGSAIVPTAEGENVQVARVLSRPDGCFNSICSKEGKATAALRFRHDRTRLLDKRFAKAYELIRCAPLTSLLLQM
jgi:hypothetical protein